MLAGASTTAVPVLQIREWASFAWKWCRRRVLKEGWNIQAPGDIFGYTRRAGNGSGGRHVQLGIDKRLRRNRRGFPMGYCQAHLEKLA